ncbi:hypothetical protein SO694_000134133 [Aureococcus anophagefferens]|uniref:RING-type domain-containing protein n=1 Tax=Aureococcus anophagefferens TaxID=44056 RepID=A0ABR1G1H5_AURAN
MSDAEGPAPAPAADEEAPGLAEAAGARLEALAAAAQGAAVEGGEAVRARGSASTTLEETGVIPPDALDQMRGGAGGAPVAPENAGGDVEAPPLAPAVAPAARARARRFALSSRPSRPSCSTSCGPRRTPSTPSASPAPRPPSAPTSAAPRPALVAAKLDGDLDATWGLVFAPAWGVLAIFVGVATTLCNCAPLLSAGMPARVRRRAVRLALARRLDADEAHRGRVDRVWDRRDCGALEAASLAGDAYGALPALNVTAAFDSLCGALDKRDAKSSPTTDAILLPVICMYAALFVLHPLVLRDSKKFQQVVQIVVIEADDGLAEARAQLARQQLQGVFELSGAPRSMIGVEDDSVLVEALAMPTRLLKHSSTLYARAAVAPLDVDDALPPLGLQLPDLKAAAAPPDLDDAPETPRKPPRKVLEAPAAPEDDGAAAAGDGGAAPEVGDGDDDDDASLGSSACESSIFDDGALDADLDAPPPRRAASPVKDKHLCYVCCLARRNAVIMECGHGGLCFECGKSLAQRHPRTCQRPVAVKIFERF